MKKIYNVENIKKDLKYLTGAMMGGFLLGALICFLIVRVFCSDDPDITTVLLGCFMATVAGIGFLLFWGTLTLKGRFEMTVCMSRTRKNFIVQETVGTVFVIVVMLVYGCLFYEIDNLLQQTIYRGIPVDMEMNMAEMYNSFVMKPFNFIAIVCMIVGIRFLFGALFAKFGQKFFWGFWIAWMIICMAPARLASTRRGEEFFNSLNQLSDMTKWCGGYFVQLLLVIISILLFLASAVLLMKQEAKGY